MLVQFILMLLYQVFQLVFGWAFPYQVKRFFDLIVERGIDPILSFMHSMPYIPWVALFYSIGAIVAVYVGLLLIKFVMLIVGMIKGVFAK